MNVFSFVCFTLLQGSLVLQSISASFIARIVGGDEAQIKHFPYQASIREKGDHFCGGAIIGNRHILTAAHCVYDAIPPYEHLTVNTGVVGSRSKGNVHRVASITVHSQWSPDPASSHDNDIAVIELQKIMKFNDKQQAILLPNRNVVNGGKGTLTGWGSTDPDADLAKTSEKLQQLKLTIIDETHCQPHHSHRILEGQFCAYHSMNHGPCHGDSGGPLAINNQIVGIASWIYGGDCATGKPDVYTNVYHYLDFIRSTMNWKSK